MRILMVTPMPPARQAANAVPLVTHAQLAALTPKHEVTVVAVAGPDPAELAALEALRRAGQRVYAVRRAEPSGLGTWKRRQRLADGWLLSGYPFRTAWYRAAGVQRILDRLLAEERFDLVTVVDNAMGIYRYATSRRVLLTEVEVRRPRRFVLPAPGVDFPAQLLAEVDWQRWRAYQCRVWPRFERLQVFTLRDAEAATAIAPGIADRIRINPFGIELPNVPPSEQEVPDSVVFTGGMSHPPNVDAAIWLGTEIMPILRRLRRGVRLIIVGSYPPPEVRALACDDIMVTGTVPEVEPYVASAAVVVAPVRTGGGQRMKVLQGMAMGKAMVATPRGLEGLSMGNCTPPVAVGQSAEAIARRTAELLQSDPERHDLGNRARAYVEEHFSVEAYARRLEAIYREVL